MVKVLLLKVIILISCLSLLGYCAILRAQTQPQETAIHLTSQGQTEFPFLKGETIKYVIKSFGLRVGEASLTFEGETDVDGKAAYLIVFEAGAVNFYDEERIYADKEKFFPLRVERDLNIWGKKEKIVEDYNQQTGTVTITKVVAGKKTTQEIDKDGILDNIYCFIYRSRLLKDFHVGDSFAISVPTDDVTMNIVKKMKIKAAGEQYDSYYLASDPPKYKVWFGTGKKKIPLRINGSVGLSNTAMIMVEYSIRKQIR